MGKVYFKGILLAVFIGLLGLVGSFYLSKQVSDSLKSQKYIKLEHAAKQISLQFQAAIDISTNDLEALQAFYSSVEQSPTQKEFNQYMTVLDIQQRHYIQALSWVPQIRHEKREIFEARLKYQQADFRIKQRDQEGNLIASRPKAYYTPVTYISPYQINKAAQGFDLSSNPVRHASLLQARDSGKMTATSKIRLVQETGESFGFLIIAPVYNKGSYPSTQKELINQLFGYVTGVFRIDTLMENARKEADNIGLEIALFDIEESDTSLLYGEQYESNDFSFDILIPDRYWQLKLSMTPALKQEIESPSIAKWVWSAGSLISLLLALSCYALLTSMFRSRHISQLSQQLQAHNRQLEDTVAERTRALSSQNELLNKHVDRLKQQKISLSRLRDESENAKLDAQNLAKELARSNQDLDEFAYVASHDLKAPLQGVKQLSSWVIEDLEEEKFDEIPNTLELIRGRVTRLETLLNDLLEYSRANRQGTTLARLDSHKLIKDCFPLYAPARGFNLIIEGELPVFDTYRAPFEQVVRNLLNNAFKHHHKEEGEIHITCDHFNENFYKFMIKDDGPGIESNHFDSIFKMFKTLKSRDEVEGSGMGLALIKKIVEYYHGHVYLESSIGEGCAFYFTWPKRIENSENKSSIGKAENT